MPGFTVDLHGDDEESVERGEFAPAGWYYCRLKDAFTDEANASRTQFRYEILNGPFTGKVIRDQIDDADSVDMEKATTIRRRTKLLAKRLGLFEKTDYGNADVAKDWADAIGTEVLVNVQEREYEKKDKSKGKIAGPAFDGIFPLDYPKDRFPKEFREKHMGLFAEWLTGPDKAEDKKSGGVATASGGGTATATAPAKSKRFTTDDL